MAAGVLGDAYGDVQLNRSLVLHPSGVALATDPSLRAVVLYARPAFLVRVVQGPHAPPGPGLVVDPSRLEATGDISSGASPADEVGDPQVLASTANSLRRRLPAAPGWRAWVDGIEAPVLTVNGALRGVAVAPGAGVVTWEYWPPGLLSGLLLAVPGAALFVTVIRSSSGPLGS